MFPFAPPGAPQEDWPARPRLMTTLGMLLRDMGSEHLPDALLVLREEGADVAHRAGETALCDTRGAGCSSAASRCRQGRARGPQGGPEGPD